MGDRVSFTFHLYDWPNQETPALVGLLTADEVRLADPDHTDHLSDLAGVYPEEEATRGFGRDLAARLQQAAPGSSWEMWENPTGNCCDGPQVGELHMYTPGLGPFGPATCDAAGDVVLTFAQATRVLEGCDASTDPAEAFLFEAYGMPWKRAFRDYGDHPREPRPIV